MKKILLTAVSLGFLTFPINSMAADDSFYIKANIGVGMILNSDIDNLFSTGNTAKMTYDSGFVGSFAAGYDFANPFRVELEIVGQQNDLDITSYNNQYSSFNAGDLKTRSFMFNGFYDVDTGSAWTPFAGLGMGWGRVVVNDPGFRNSDSDDVFSYQLIGGVSYAFNERWSLDGQYRFTGTSEATIDGSDFNVTSNDVMVGVRFSF